jgi:hypothetical protein
MKKILYIITIGAVLFMCSCTNKDHLFDAEVVDRFSTTDFASILGTNSVTFHAENSSVLFAMQPGYIRGGSLHSPLGLVEIAIFKSKKTALVAMEAQRKNVAADIKQGKKDINGIKHWWFVENQAFLSIVYENMVFEVASFKNRYSAIEKELWATATNFIKKAEQTITADGGE